MIAKRTIAVALLSASVVLGAAGCAPRDYYANTSAQLDSLLTTQADLQKRIAALDRKVENSREGVQSFRASTDTRLTEISQRVDMLQGKLEESGLRFTQLAQKVETVKQKISSGDSARAGYYTRRDSTGYVDPETAYQTAYSDVAAGRYELARAGFTEYLKRFPDTEVSDNAQYWIGECAYSTGDFAGAIEAFQTVVQKYPKGDKVAAALLKTGISYSRLKNAEEAKKYYKLVIQKYPKSDEARLAKERMQ